MDTVSRGLAIRALSPGTTPYPAKLDWGVDSPRLGNFTLTSFNESPSQECHLRYKGSSSNQPAKLRVTHAPHGAGRAMRCLHNSWTGTASSQPCPALASPPVSHTDSQEARPRLMPPMEVLAASEQ